MKKILLFLLLVQTAYAIDLNAVELDLGLADTNIELFGTSRFYNYKDIAKATDTLKTKEVSTFDYAYKGALFVAEMKVFSIVVTQKRSVRAAETRAAKKAMKDLGLTSTNLQTALLQGGTRVANKLAIYKIEDFLISNESIFDFLKGIFLKRPTPGGLRLAAHQAIYLASEDYAYALDHGANPNDPNMLQARDSIRHAVNLYKSYLGLVDTFTLTYSVYAPEGYSQIVSDCTIAMDFMQSALSPSAKTYQVVAH